MRSAAACAAAHARVTDIAGAASAPEKAHCRAGGPIGHVRGARRWPADPAWRGRPADRARDAACAACGETPRAHRTDMRIRDDHRCIHACDAATAPRRFRDGDVANDNGTDIDIDIDIARGAVRSGPRRSAATLRAMRGRRTSERRASTDRYPNEPLFESNVSRPGRRSFRGSDTYLYIDYRCPALVFDAHHTANRAIDHTRRRSACARVISRAAAASTGKPAIWEASA